MSTNANALNAPLPLGISQGGTSATTITGAQTALDLLPGTNVQAYSASLAALAALAGTGFIAQTGANTFAERTLTGTANEISITNTTGAGNPVFSFPSGGIIVSNILDTNALPIIEYLTASSAANYFTMGDSAATSGGIYSISGTPILAVKGSDANINLGVQFKGEGSFSIFGNGSYAGTLQITEVTNTYGTTIAGNNSMSTQIPWVLPSAQGVANTSLTNDGSGNLSWVAQVPLAGGTMTGALILSGAPSASLQAATKAYVDAAVTSIVSYAPVVAASTVAYTVTYSNGTSGVGATLTNAGTQAAFSIDGIAGVSSDRYLIKNQAAPAQNGVYTLTTVGSGSTNWVLTRSTDFDSSSTIVQNALFAVTGGNTQSGSSFVQATAGPFTVGTTALVFNLFLSGGAGYVAGTGLTLTGSTFSVTPTITAGGPISYPVITYNAEGQLTAVTTATTPLLPANNLSDVSSSGTARSNLGLAIGSQVQAYNSGLSAIAANAAFNQTAYVVQDGVNTFASVTLTGTANQISIAGLGTSGGGSGNPTFSLPSSLQGINQFIDPNGNPLLGFNYLSPADSYISIVNAPASLGDNPLIIVNSTQNNCGLTIQTRGTGALQIEGSPASSPGILKLFTSATAYAQIQPVNGNTATTNITLPPNNGVAGQYLQNSDGAGTCIWATPGASTSTYQKISSQIAGSSSSIIFTGLSNSFSFYKIKIINAILSNVTGLQLQVSTNGGSTWQTGASYIYNNNQFAENDVLNITVDINSPAQLNLFANNLTANTTIYPICGDLDLFGCGVSGSVFTFFVNFNFAQQPGSGISNVTASGNAISSITNINAIKILPQSGTIISGTFNLYGIL